MARIEEATLFRPDPKLSSPGGRGGGTGGSGGGGRRDDDDDGPSIALGARLGEAARSARRRKGLSFVVMMICGALTVLAAIFAPRSYGVESRVLVQRTQPINAQQTYVSAEEMRNTAKEYEEQMLARESVIEIVKKKNLVARWDDMRQPHRRLVDKLNRKMGKPPPSDEEKFDALVGMIASRMKVWVDATTVMVKLDWPEPESARDIVDQAVQNFLAVRNQSEVGVLPDDIKILEAGVTQAHKDLELAAAELVRLQKLADPKKQVALYIPPMRGANDNRPRIDETAVDPALKAKLDNVRQQIQVLQEAKLRRIAELNQELIQKRQVLADGHPEIQALKQTIAATEADPPQLVSLRKQEADIMNDVASKQASARAANAEPPQSPLAKRAAPVTEPKPEIVAGQAKNVQDAQVLFDTVTKKYTEIANRLDVARIDMKKAEAAFKNRYKVTQPAEVPLAPKRPVGMIAIAIGILATLLSILGVAALADRFSGIFFEPRDVRDRLELPVFATFS